MAFIFPEDKADFTAPNGIIYHWDGTKWIVKAFRSTEDFIVEIGDDPPDNPKEGDLWYDTHEDDLTLYIWTGSVWVPAAPPVSLDGIEDSIASVDAELTKVNANIAMNKKDIDDLRLDISEGDFRPNLEQVLEQGNVADKGFVLTNLENDAILVSPEQARIMVGGVGPSVVPRVELRHETGIHDTSLVKLELDEDGSRFDIECDEKVDNIHFRFENDVKFELNKTGDAVFNGKVKVTPATNGDEVPTLNQVSEATELLQLEIDQITSTFERGAWMYDDGDGVTQETEYVLSGTQTQDNYDNQVTELNKILSQCMEEAGEDVTAKSACSREYTESVDALVPVGDTIHSNQWHLANKITFSTYDLDGDGHSFFDVKVGQIIDMLCEDGSYMIAEITGVLHGMWHENKHLDITPVKSNGVANGKTRVKIFTLDDTVDTDKLDDYVRKPGDTMTGTLNIKPSTSVTSLDVYRGAGVASNDTVFRVRGADDSNFYVTSGGNIGASSGYSPTNNRHLTTKAYVDEAVKKYAKEEEAKPSRHSWIYRDGPGFENVKAGEFGTQSAEPWAGEVMYLSNKTNSGTLYYPRTNVKLFDYSSLNGHYRPLITIWDYYSDSYRHKVTLSVTTIEMDSRGIFKVLLGSSVGSTNLHLTPGREHWVRIDGFF